MERTLFEYPCGNLMANFKSDYGILFNINVFFFFFLFLIKLFSRIRLVRFVELCVVKPCEMIEIVLLS